MPENMLGTFLLQGFEVCGSLSAALFSLLFLEVPSSPPGISPESSPSTHLGSSAPQHHHYQSQHSGSFRVLSFPGGTEAWVPGLRSSFQLGANLAGLWGGLLRHFE